jgi:hypothetical protein
MFQLQCNRNPDQFGVQGEVPAPIAGLKRRVGISCRSELSLERIARRTTTGEKSDPLSPGRCHLPRPGPVSDPEPPTFHVLITDERGRGAREKSPTITTKEKQNRYHSNDLRMFDPAETNKSGIPDLAECQRLPDRIDPDQGCDVWSFDNQLNMGRSACNYSKT